MHAPPALPHPPLLGDEQVWVVHLGPGGQGEAAWLGKGREGEQCGQLLPTCMQQLPASAHGRRGQAKRRPTIPCTMYQLLLTGLPPTFSNSSLMGLMKALLTSSAASRPSCIAAAVSSTPKYTMT